MDIREKIARYLTKRFIAPAEELPPNECYKEADYIIPLVRADEHKRLIKEGLFTEKQMLYKLTNQLRSDSDSLHGKMFQRIYDSRYWRNCKWIR